MTFLRSQHIVQRGERAVVWFGIKSARKRLEVPEKTVVNGQVRERENNDFQRSRGRRGNISLQIFRRAADPLWRQARTNIKSQRRAHLAGSFPSRTYPPYHARCHSGSTSRHPSSLTFLLAPLATILLTNPQECALCFIRCSR